MYISQTGTSFSSRTQTLQLNQLGRSRSPKMLSIRLVLVSLARLSRGGGGGGGRRESGNTRIVELCSSCRKNSVNVSASKWLLSG